jgi:ankyrin repeat protein
MKKIWSLLLISLTTFTVMAQKEKWDDYKEDWSPLMLAIYNGQLEKIDILLAEKVDVNFSTSGSNSNWQLTALDVAIRKDNEIAVEKLLSTHKIANPETYLMTASGQKSAKNVQLLIDYGANPNQTLENGYAVAMKAASFGSYDILECLLKNGANIHQTRKVDGMTILMFAAFNGEPEKVKLLLDWGADKSVQDLNGKRAYDYVDQMYEHLNVSNTTKAELKQLLQ